MNYLYQLNGLDDDNNGDWGLLDLGFQTYFYSYWSGFSLQATDPDKQPRDPTCLTLDDALKP